MFICIDIDMLLKTFVRQLIKSFGVFSISTENLSNVINLLQCQIDGFFYVNHCPTVSIGYKFVDMILISSFI